MCDADILPQDYIRELYERFLALKNACIKVKAAVRTCEGDFPVYVPTCSEDEAVQVSETARDAALKAITQLFRPREGEYMADAGILCASASTVQAIAQLNAAKAAFKTAILAIRAYQKKENIAVSKIDKLINDELLVKGRRTDHLNEAMRTVGIRSLDLKRCYATIRIMPENLAVFSWTWATTHSRVKKVTVKEALAMARSLSDEKKRESALDSLSRCKDDEVLVRRIRLANQLRANYAYREDGAIIRRSCPISGVVIAQQRVMPRMFWRDDPGMGDDKPQRLLRLSRIEKAAFVPSLGLHRYVS